MPEIFAPRRAAGALVAALLAAAPLSAQTTPASGPVRPPPPPASARPAAASDVVPVAAGARPLSLDEALTLAEEKSDQIVIAEAGVMRARGQRLQAASQRYPQLGATASY